MKTTYAKIEPYNGGGEYRIIRDENRTSVQFAVVRCFYDAAECGYGMTKKQKTLARFDSLKSALLYAAQLV